MGFSESRRVRYFSEQSSRNIFYRNIGKSRICLFRLVDLRKMASVNIFKRAKERV